MPHQFRRQMAAVMCRWLLAGLAMAGIVVMHVLSMPDSGVGHGMLMTAGSMRSQHAEVHSEMTAAPMLMPDTVASTAVVVPSVSLATPDNGMSGSMAMCLLYLGAATAGVALLLLRKSRPGPTAGQLSTSAQVWRYRLRGPPGAVLPRFSLCVLRT